MWKLLRGYVILKAEGMHPARFLRRLPASGIPVFGIKSCGETSVVFCVPARDVRRLRPIRRRERCRLHILERHGFPFLWKRMLRRPVLLFGIPIAAAAVWIALSRIWFIRIDGTERTRPEEVLAMLDERGISVGKAPQGTMLIQAADDLSAQLREAAWVSLNRDGVVLRVTVQESDPQHTLIDRSRPSNVIAAKDAVIVSVETKRGKAAVSGGDRVYQGDVLISGHVVYSEDRTPYDTYAEGTVTGACVYTADAELPTSVTEYMPTGETGTIRTLLLAGVPVLHSHAPFAHYRETGTRTVSIARTGLPIGMTVVSVEELAERERILTEPERREQAELSAYRAAVALVPEHAAICSIHTTERVENGTVRIRCTVVTEEQIGINKEYTQ